MKRRAQRRLLAALIPALLAGCVVGTDDVGESHDHEHDHDHGEETQVRLGVADAAGNLYLYDGDGEHLATYALGEQPSITTTESGRYGVLVLRTANQVRFLDSGLYVEEHGDHVHLEAEAPALLDYTLAGADFGSERPVHVVSHDGRIAVFFDGDFDNGIDGKGIALHEADLEEAVAEDPLVFTTTAHHGVLVPSEDDTFILTEPDPARAHGSLPNGFRIYDESQDERQAFLDTCAGMHGEVTVGEHVLFGCDEDQGGVYVMSHDDTGGGFSGRLLAYPEVGQRAYRFAGHSEAGLAVTPWGSDAMLRIDPEADSLTADDVLTLPAQQCGYAFEDEGGEHFAVLTVDGLLRVYESADWGEVGSFRVMDAFGCGSDDVKPVLAGMGHDLYLTDPATSQIVVVSLEHLEVEERLDVDIVPRAFALFRHVEEHGHEDEHEHEHEDEAGHEDEHGHSH